MKKAKKVVAVIVEGTSDEIALEGVLKEYFANEVVQFAIVRGDITISLGINGQNALCMVEQKISDELCVRYGYTWHDFLKIIHIVDTDGAFIQDRIQEAPVEKIQYYEDHIETAHVKALKSRNSQKAEVLHRLYLSSNIKHVPYKIYFNSRNLEHVLYNAPQYFTREEKQNMALDFADRFEGKLEEFLEFIGTDGFAVAGDYKATWGFIQGDTHSLERHSNMHLIFENGTNKGL